MKFTVRWSVEAENDLIKIWMRTRFRSVWTESIQRLDEMLAQQPFNCGESRDGEARVVFEGPFGCDFDVDVLRHIVVVRAIWPTSEL